MDLSGWPKVEIGWVCRTAFKHQGSRASPPKDAAKKISIRVHRLPVLPTQVPATRKSAWVSFMF